MAKLKEAYLAIMDKTLIVDGYPFVVSHVLGGSEEALNFFGEDDLVSMTEVDWEELRKDDDALPFSFMNKEVGRALNNIHLGKINGDVVALFIYWCPYNKREHKYSDATIVAMWTHPNYRRLKLMTLLMFEGLECIARFAPGEDTIILSDQVASAVGKFFFGG